jgi:hypothetical protein
MLFQGYAVTLVHLFHCLFSAFLRMILLILLASTIKGNI